MYTKMTMASMKIVILAVICLSQISQNDAASQIARDTLDFPDKELIFNYDSYKDGTVTYATCIKNNATDERRCKVVREKSPNSRESWSCDVMLKLDHRKGKIGKKADEIFILPLGKNHAVLYLIEKGKDASVKFDAINFNNCKVAQNEISIMNPDHNTKQGVIVIPYNESYDVFYRDSHRCGESGHCQVTFSTEGKQIRGPDAAIDVNLYLSFFPYILPVAGGSRNRGIFYMKYIGNSTGEYEFILKKSNGEYMHKTLLLNGISIQYE